MSLDKFRFWTRTRDATESILEERQALQVTECKKSIRGALTCVECRLIEQKPDRVTLFHALDDRWNIDGMIIEPPMFTLATYWADRPYNLYCWFQPDGAYVGAYFNVVELPGFQFTGAVLTYHDLVLDVLVRPDQEPVILDMEELVLLESETARRAKGVAGSLLISAREIVDECMSDFQKS